ncbi:MAG: class I SAM-dependent methyltransferase [Gammaproteobacteria bacterium]
MNALGQLHSKLVFGRRVRVLAAHLCKLFPPGAQVLDVGCGDGTIDSLMLESRPDISIRGVDVLVRPETRVPVSQFDGKVIPYEDGSFDAVLFIDVLHHTQDPYSLLVEARRVSRGVIVLKDHTKDGLLAGPALRFMDWFGNSPHGVALPYNYWTEAQWLDSFNKLGLSIDKWTARVGLYPWPASHVFDRGLHFVARLTYGGAGRE